MKKIKKIKKITLSLLSMTIIFGFTNVSSTQAAEKYYYKGAAYSPVMEIQGSGKPIDTGKSSIVLSVATTYDQRSTGKERIRVWTREEVVRNYYDANATTLNYVRVRFGSPDNITLLVDETQILPKESVGWRDIPALDWLFSTNVWLNAAYQTSKALSGSMKAQITHKITDNNKEASITFSNGLLSGPKSELPGSISYKDGDKYYNGILNTQTGVTTKNATASGLGTYFGYKYILGSGQTGKLTAAADALYDMKDADEYGHGLVYSVKTGKASLTHTIGGS
ncbi:hypothetical protein PV403_24405 [Paenibacillus sp. GYB006]|uniref:hypothetical protein n=1 Tax=Paenibacillus sp. GYB006 TaxID=2994394 RepID=UPI002F962BE1